MADTEAAGGKAANRRGGLVLKLAGGLAFVAAAGAAGLGAAVGVLKFGREYLPAPAASSAPVIVVAPAKPMEYLEIDTAFTSNLVDTGRYLQVRLSVGTTAGPGVTAALTQHKPAVVSAVLAVLAEAGEADVASRAAKDQLRVRVRDVINAVLRERGVSGGVDEVFFTSLVIQ
jgi:flagellar FliL protein